MNQRGSGVLVPVTSLFSPYGIGDLGPSACRFVDFLSDARQRYWQILPLHPTRPEYDNSPYHSTSTFAFNTLLISPDRMAEEGLLHEKDLEGIPEFPDGTVDYERVIRYKEHLFTLAHERFMQDRTGGAGFGVFCRNNSWWLEDFSLFHALHRHFRGKPWSAWPDALRYRDTEALDAIRHSLLRDIDREKFLQYVFASQWQLLRKYCIQKGIRLIGDIPLYVSYDSADVWSHPELFRLDDRLHPLGMAGVPPDYFSRTGQLWKNPLYCWEEHERTGFSWWLHRVGHTLSLVDYARIDHFRGLVAYWEVPAGAPDARDGKWVPAPGEKLLTHLKHRFGDLPLIAEDLGTITPDVHDIIDRFGLPGMRVLLFAFADDPSKSPHAPHNLRKNCILYTGTHDNTTVRGWLESEATPAERQRLLRYIGRQLSAEQVPPEMLRLAMMSVADTVIFPLQDILGLGAGARMNRPGTDRGNWRWRLNDTRITSSVTEKLAELTEVYGRT